MEKQALRHCMDGEPWMPLNLQLKMSLIRFFFTARELAKRLRSELYCEHVWAYQPFRVHESGALAH